MTSAETLNVYYACSTIVIGGFYGGLGSFEEFKEGLRNNAFMEDDKYDGEKHKWLKKERLFKDHNGKLHKKEKFAFVMASTNQEQFVQPYLRKLGFQETPEQYNSKNASTVQLWFCPMPVFLQNLYGKTKGPF